MIDSASVRRSPAGSVALLHGEFTKAHAYFGECLRLRRMLGDRAGIGWCLQGFARVALEWGQPCAAAQLAGAIEALWEAIGESPSPARRARLETGLNKARALVGVQAAARAHAAGRQMGLEAAIELALSP